MNILFWMDPISTIQVEKDSTYLLIHECLQQNLTPFFIESISMKPSKLILECATIKPFTIGEELSFESCKHQLTQLDIHAIWLRKDPPVNNAYVRDLLILNQFKNDILLLNNPTGVLMNNEKLAATQFESLTPKTLVSSNKNSIKTFINENKECVIKPLDGYGGTGIFKLTENDSNLDTIIELSTKNESEQVICQQTVNHQLGDKRVLLLDGEPIGAVKRINYNGHRNNFMAGGIAEPATITKNDQIIIKAIKPFLEQNQLFFVGIDIIDNYLIEINVTSPTGVQEINKLNQTNLQQKIIQLMKERVDQL
ncbi:MAG: glutathione synthase [Candidatus Margulisiibacteriota bacterium]|nr:glutathione synthase [Candidatus Margulisiibacteriota bacterium]